MGRPRLLLAIAAVLVSAAAAASPLGPDGTPGQRFPGRFVWFDLATENPAGARAFYGAVFGWKFREAPGAPRAYTIAENAAGKVAGIFEQRRPAGGKVGARWLSLMSVPDAAKAASTVRARGGQVVLEPKTVPGRGTHAVFRDPEGAVFGVLAAEGGDPPDTPVVDGDVFWLDLFSHDPAKAAAFYAEVGGYDVDVGEIAGHQRTILSTRGIARAGIAQVPLAGDPPGWLPYFLVEDLRGTLERARQAGGRLIMAPRPDVLGGNLAVIADPEGGVVGVLDWVDDAASAGAAR
jgi:predicted enzyme related to lactoylglutathione lyase